MARRSIRARRNRCRRTSAPADRTGHALRAAARHGGGRVRAQDLTWTEHGEGPGGETGIVTARPEAWGDVILARKETPTSYHLSVVIDDALQGVTDVVRGQDLFWSTSVHRLLQTSARYSATGLPASPAGAAMTPDKSSRSRPGPPACANCARQGATPADIRRLVGSRSSFRKSTEGCRKGHP